MGPPQVRTASRRGSRIPVASESRPWIRSRRARATAAVEAVRSSRSARSSIQAPRVCAVAAAISPKAARERGEWSLLRRMQVQQDAVVKMVNAKADVLFKGWSTVYSSYATGTNAEWVTDHEDNIVPDVPPPRLIRSPGKKR